MFKLEFWCLLGYLYRHISIYSENEVPGLLLLIPEMSNLQGNDFYLKSYNPLMFVPATMLSLIESSNQLYFSFNLKTEKFIYLNPAFRSLFKVDIQIHFFNIFETCSPRG